MNVYLARYRARMRTAPPDVDRFCDPQLAEPERAVFLRWLRNVEEADSSQTLQIRYAFSVPSDEALAWLCRVPVRAIVSPGAGLAYWEALLTGLGLAVVPFDNKSWFPEAMQHMPVLTGSVETLSQPFPVLAQAFADVCIAEQWPDAAARLRDCAGSCSWEETALLLAWPDDCEKSEFGHRCLQLFQGPWVIHIGELVGATCSANPWGQSTSQQCQLELFSSFRQVAAHPLPNWPGHRDAITVWHRVRDVVSCEGADFVFAPSRLPSASPSSAGATPAPGKIS